jgi:hypothetical protein
VEWGNHWKDVESGEATHMDVHITLCMDVHITLCMDVHITLCGMILTCVNNKYQKMLELATHVELFQKKRHELAWTFLNTMNNVHHCYNLYNNMLLDNVMLHFPPNFPDKIYIYICDWTTAGNFNDLKDFSTSTRMKKQSPR